MTQYLLSVHMVEGEPTAYVDEATTQRAYAQVDTFNAKLQATGAWVFAGGLEPADTATTVTKKDGKVTMTDGPFAETKEKVGGFWVIEAKDLDVALELAAEASEACMAPVEVRPFQSV